MRRAPLTSADLWRWGSPIEHERQRRIMLAVWAYAYEIANAPMVHDDHFDATARRCNPTIRTGRFDDWWREAWSPHTGQWIHDHPALGEVERYYKRLTTIAPHAT